MYTVSTYILKNIPNKFSDDPPSFNQHEKNHLKLNKQQILYVLDDKTIKHWVKEEEDFHNIFILYSNFIDLILFEKFVKNPILMNYSTIY